MTAPTASRDPDGPSAAGLAGGVLEAEAERRARQAGAEGPGRVADDLLPGVGDAHLPLRAGLGTGGVATFAVLTSLAAFQELESAALPVLAPDIRDSLGVSDGTIVFLAAASGAFLVLGALPLGRLADRYRRGRVAGWAGVLFALMVVSTGLAANAFLLFLGRLGVGAARSGPLPVHGSLIADAYPIGIRGRLAAAAGIAVRTAAVAGPLAVAGIAAVAGGDEGWRWPFLILGPPVAIIGLLALRLPEPTRGRYEMASVLGEVLEDRAAPPIPAEAALARLLRVRTLRAAAVAFAAVGFGLFTAPIFAGLWLDDHFGVGTLGRGVIVSLGGACAVAILPFLGPRYDRLYRGDPARAVALLGNLVLAAALLLPVPWFMPNAVAFAVAGVPAAMLLAAVYAMIVPVLQSVVPYRLRGLGGALGTVYVFFAGAVGGALVGALISDAYDPRAACLAVGVPVTLAGGLLLRRGADAVKDDLTLVVAELHEEREERDRRAQAPGSIPAVQVTDVDFSYGPVQVLFGVSFEVGQGEVLALLGANGAGKSTLLKAVCGLARPTRGAVRFDGRSVTHVGPEHRCRLGVQLMPGGAGVFPDLTVQENLRVAAFTLGADIDHDERRAHVLGLFPDLGTRLGQRAGSLSGGQQQMLALAMVLLHRPRVLLIDELSLGLAPVVVQDLLQVIGRLKAEGITMVIVEQSMNVALALADRAVFLEKGQVRFAGPAHELAGRADLAKAVFFDGGRDLNS